MYCKVCTMFLIFFMLKIWPLSWASDGRFINVALHKHCNMSSQHPLINISGAVNGDREGPHPRNCVHSLSPDPPDTSRDPHPWWEVDLGRPYPVLNISVWPRRGQKYRMTNCTITVDEELCYQFPRPEDENQVNNIISTPTNVTCRNGVINGSVVRVSKTDKDVNWNIINICEFEVFSCSDAYWGGDCSRTCGQCTVGEACDKVTGHCSSCQAGWKAPLCAECEDGLYGADCEQSCSDGCDDVCNNVNGFCTCKAGWTNDRCDTTCPTGSFGPQCSQKCSEGCSDTCRHDTGVCSCKPAWTGELCEQEALEQPNEAFPTALIVGAIVGVVVAAVVVVVVVVLVRRRRTAAKPRTETAPQTNAAFSGDANIYQNISPVQSKPAMAASDESSKEPTQPPAPKKAVAKCAPYSANGNEMSKPAPAVETKPTPAVQSKPAHAVETKPTPAVQSKPAPTVQSKPAPTVQTKSTPAVQTKPTPAPKDVPFEPPEIEPEVEVAAKPVTARQGNVYYNDDTYMTSEGASMALDSVQQFLVDKLKGSEIGSEFRLLPEGLVRDHDRASDQENYYRNRFNTIVPYDDRRVVLRGPPDPGSNDYINASYIRGPKSAKDYIASQGPKRNTLGDFWKMVWQDHVTLIVMLTNLKEGERKKCDKYWPDFGEEGGYGSVTVTGTEEDVRAHYVKRTFGVQREDEGARQVTQYHYTTWPDHGVPSSTALVDFWKTVHATHAEEKSESPLLVHCSAGVGRSGTFIALDTLMAQLQQQSGQHPRPDVLSAVQGMRQDRCTMIQTLSQYRMLHEALLEAYTSRDCRIKVTAFDQIFTSTIDPGLKAEHIDKEFKKVKQMKLLLHKPSCREAEKPENLNKNRWMDVLPDDIHIVRLTDDMEGRNDYINAVWLETFNQECGNILTQLPLSDTIVDFWRLVAACDVKMIISLGVEIADGADPNCYWPHSVDQVMNYGPLTIHCTSASLLGQRLKHYKMSLVHTDHLEPREVELIHASEWKGDTGSNVDDLLTLTQTVMQFTAAAHNTTSPLLLQCSDGATKSGLFAAIIDVIRRMTSDREMDVYTAVRNLHVVRPQCVTSEAQYRFIYSVVQQHIRNHSLYHNLA